MRIKKENPYTFNKIKSFNLEIFEILYEIIKKNMISLGFKADVESKQLWLTNIKNMLQNNNFYLFSIKFDNEICGFIELVESNSILIVSEIQLIDKVKGSYLILHILNFLMNNDDLKKFNTVHFSINNKNVISIKTFKHLGAKVINKRDNSSTYELERGNIKRYLTFTKFSFFASSIAPK